MTQENLKLKTFLEKAYGKELSDEEMLEYKNRLVKFFDLLIQIDQRIKRQNEAKNN